MAYSVVDAMTSHLCTFFVASKRMQFFSAAASVDRGPYVGDNETLIDRYTSTPISLSGFFTT